MSEFNLLKRIATAIRYRELKNIKGKSIDIESLGDLETTIIAVVNAELSIDNIISHDFGNVLSFLKYGLFDITIEVPFSTLASDYRKGVRLLAEMKWLDKEGYVEDENDSLLMDLWENIEDERAYVRLHLQAKNYSTPSQNIELPSNLDKRERQILNKLLSLDVMKQYDFPNRFVFQDAFISNVRDIAMMKNFYL